MPAPSTRPTLYTGTKNASSWAMRAWLALRAADVAFEEIVVDIRRPQRYANLARMGEIAPPSAVPVLVVGGTVIYDSNAIMEYANDRCSGRLLPADVEARARARSLVAWQHAGLSAICGRISFESAFYPVRRALTAAEQAECVRLFAHYAELLSLHEGPYLFGDLSLADLMHVPTVVRLFAHEPDVAPWPAVGRWARRLLGHPLVREWMEEAERLPPVWIADYLVEDAWPSAAAR